MATIPYVLIVVIVTIALADAVDYCNSKRCKEHTMCRFPSNKPSKSCASYKAASLTDQEKKEILDVHNRFRGKVASGKETRGLNGVGQPAGYIGSLKWDDELEQVAQRWADQCNFSHDTCRDVDRYSVGQNIAIKMHSDGYKATMTELVQMWYDEVKDFDARQVSSYKFSSKTGHYTQLVWANTTTIGCGVVKYRRDSWYATYLVCNYGPSGNWQGQPMYKTR